MTEPAAKKQKTNNLPVFDRVAADAEMRTLLRKQASALKHLKSSQEQEAETLKEKHDKAEREARKASTRVVAGTESDEYFSGVCGTCAKAFSGDIIKDDSISASHFCCGKCSEYHCNEHKDDMTKCEACSATYCQDCVDTINTCSGCRRCPQLTCCDLERMPCGEYESGDCVYYHYKHCSCQSTNNRWWWVLDSQWSRTKLWIYKELLY